MKSAYCYLTASRVNGSLVLFSAKEIPCYTTGCARALGWDWDGSVATGLVEVTTWWLSHGRRMEFGRFDHTAGLSFWNGLEYEVC